MDWIEVFRTGRHTDSAGITRDWTEEDLAMIAKSYDPAQHEAPMVIGHPELDAPAYGWAEALRVEGGKLLAKPKQVAEQLRQWVKEGRYKKISIALYPDMTLRHIGFLGAQPPAVKGLAQAAFADAGRAWTYIEPYQEQTIKSLFARLRDWLIEEKGLEAADKLISPYDLEALNVQTAPPAIAGPGYHEPGAVRPPTSPSGEGGTGMRDWLKAFQAKLAALFAEAETTLPADGAVKTAPTIQTFSEADVKSREEAAAKRGRDEALAQAAREARARDVHSRVTQFVEAGVTAGTFLPAWREQGLPAVLEQALLAEQPLTFADGKDPKNPGEILLGIFEGLPKVVTFGEVASAQKAIPEAGGAGVKLEHLTREYLKANKGMAYSAAFAEVQQAHPELATAYAEEVRGK